MQTLYELTDAYLQLLEMASDPETDLSVFADTLEAVEGDLEVKAEGYAIVNQELQTKIDGITREIDRLMAWRSAVMANKRRLNEALMGAMEAMGKRKLETEHFRISIARNGGKQPMYVTPSVEDIPEAFIVRKPEPDKEKIRAALEAGEELGFAHLEERGQHLNIR